MEGAEKSRRREGISPLGDLCIFCALLWFFFREAWAGSELIPEVLVGHFVVELHLTGLHHGAQGLGAAFGLG